MADPPRPGEQGPGRLSAPTLGATQHSRNGAPMSDTAQPSMETDVIDPATVDWEKANDSAVYWAAKDGVPQAKAELARRERENTPPIESDAE